MINKRLVAIGLAGILALAACGSDDEGSDDAAGDGGAEETTALRLWLNGEDVHDEVVASLEEQFEADHPGVDYGSSVSSGTAHRRATDDGPVEQRQPRRHRAGNTRRRRSRPPVPWSTSRTPVAASAVTTCSRASWSPAPTTASSSGVPYYAGARIVVYRTDLLAAAGLEVPTTLDEFVEAGIALQAANAAAELRASTSPGGTGTQMLSFVWDAGGDLAVQDGDEWVGSSTRRVDRGPLGGAADHDRGQRRAGWPC